MKIVWTKKARQDVLTLINLIAQDKKQAAINWANKIITHSSRLKNFPRSGRVVPELNRPEIREMIVGSYRVIYRLSEKITILTVFHGAKGRIPL